MSTLPGILLVDDDPTVNFLNRKLLERLAIAEQVLVAHNGREALAVLQTQELPPPTHPPLLLFLDVNMPVMNGIQFLEAYRQLPPPNKVRPALCCSPPPPTRRTWPAPSN